MDLSSKKVLVIGLGKSGTGLVEFLNRHAKSVIAFDSNESVKEHYSIDNYSNVEFFFGKNPSGEELVDLVVISPGIPLDLPFVQRFYDRKVKVIGEVELAYQSAKGRFVGITGTNGKTTTTALTGEIFKNAGHDTRVVGNIGNPIISEVESSTDETVFVAELSSFQLETIDQLHCHSAVIINLTPDHLNRHKTMENYVDAKLRIFENQDKNDFSIINLDDPYCDEIEEKTTAEKIFFSSNEDLSTSHLEKTLSISDDVIIYKDATDLHKVVELKDIFLKGKHNYENILVASALAISFGIDVETIAETVREFKGVEHRLEFVRELGGVKYYNDSKGTNPDASIKAIEALEKNIILIAGGMDKKSEFDSFVSLFPQSVKYVLLLGETRQIIADSLDKIGFTKYSFVNNMDEAVRKANEMASAGDQVLLSPACASWDMYSCFEERGDHFKGLVNRLEE